MVSRIAPAGVILDRLEKLISPFGVIADAFTLRPPRGLGDVVASATASYGYPVSRAELRYTGDIDHLRDPRRSADQGFGLSYNDPGEARLKAIAEAAERYSARDFDEPVLLSSYRDLESAALDPQRIPRCSEREIATPGCPLSTLDPAAPIRWIRGIDFATREELWIPAVMASYRLSDTLPAERFWYRISTGFAVHSDPTEALVRGICEVIERDAIAVSWLQKLPLPLIDDQHLSEKAKMIFSWGRRHFIEYWLFDATTDIGLPTALCVSVAKHASNFAQTMSCATGRTITAAAEKVMLDAGYVRWNGASADDLPADLRDFKSLIHGVRYMAAPSRRAAFDFLINDARERLSPERLTLPESPDAMLAWLVGALSRKGMSVMAVNRTTSDLAAVGLTAFNVIVPELQPMSLYPLAQYRAHPRLYSAPVLMGHHSHPEKDLNPWPIPFG